MGKMNAEEKQNSRVSLCFSYIKFLKQPFWAIYSSGQVDIIAFVFFIVVVIVVANLKSKMKWSWLAKRLADAEMRGE
jgi:hypothetical protein